MLCKVNERINKKFRIKKLYQIFSFWQPLLKITSIVKTQFMKSIISLTAFLVLFSTTHLFGQTAGDITHMALMGSSYHDSTSCSTSIDGQHQIMINNSFVGDSVKVIDFGGQPLYVDVNTSGTTPWILMPGQLADYTVESDMNVSGGYLNGVIPTFIWKIISGPDTLYNVNPITYSVPVPDACSYGNVTGKVYIDNNSNCTYEAGDSAIFALSIYPNSNYSSSPFYPTSVGYTNSSGDYTLTVQESWLIDYDVFIPPVYQFIFPNSTCTPFNYNFTSLPQSNVDFVLVCADIDTWVNGTAGGNVHAVLPFNFYPSVANIGCDQVSGTLKLVLDPNVTYNAGNSSNPADYVNGDSLYWDYVNLNNIAGGSYWNSMIGAIELTPNGNVNIGDTLCFEISTAIPGNDINAANNSKTVCIPVVASYDPNIKNVEPQGTGAEGFIPATTSELTYTIHFQNTGTAEAINISVTDSLEAHVIPSSLRILDASHSMSPEWVSSDVVKFNFNNIHLPDSNSNEPGSHGFVKFKIDMEQSLAEGTEIKNRAYIYFDNNPAVITDYALNTIEYTSTNSVDFYNNQELTIYPNPTSGKIYIKSDNTIQKIEVLDISGSVLESQSSSKNIDLSDLPIGVYFLKVYTNDKVISKKVVKQ